MKAEEALKVLVDYQKWRRGANMPQPYVGVVGEALDVAIDCLRKNCKKNNGTK
jgi:hypothetical protein